MKGLLVAMLLGGILLTSGCKYFQTQPADSVIVAEIQAKFFGDPDLKQRTIAVASNQGTVTLTGNVESADEKLAAETLTRQVSGVKGLVDSLRVIVTTSSASAGGNTVAPPNGNGASTTTSTSTDAIDQYLARKPNVTNPSPMVGLGSTFESWGNQYTVDPRLIVAISGAETSFATAPECSSKAQPAVTHNAWNWFWCGANGSCGNDPCSNSPFDSWNSGIETLSHFLRKDYINKGYNTVPLIASKYCASGCTNWIPNVKSILTDLNGDPNNLTISAAP